MVVVAVVVVVDDVVVVVVVGGGGLDRCYLVLTRIVPHQRRSRLLDPATQ